MSMEMAIDAYTVFCHDAAVPYKFVMDIIQQGIESGYKILVLNYCGNSEKTMFSEKILESVIWKDAEKLDDAEVDNIIGSLGKKYILYVLGMERLVPNIGKRAAVEMDFIGRTSRFHYEEEENWESFCEKLDRWYEKAVKSLGGLMVFLSISLETEQKITACLEKSNNMSICACRYEGDGYSIQRELIDAITSRKYTISQIKEMIEAKRGVLGESICRYLKAVSCKVAGDLQSAINILQEVDAKELDTHEKLLLADCCYMDRRGSKSLEMLEELYEEEPYTRGLAVTLIRASQGTEKEEKWIETLYQRFPEDMGVLEAYGSLKSRNGENKTAAQIFRKISGRQTGYYENYYELIARMNDIINENMREREIVWQYLYSVIDKEPQLNNEAVLRAVNYFKNVADDREAALYIMGYANMSIDEPKAAELITLKMELLKDAKTAGKGLSRIVFLQNKCEALLEAMAILCRSGETVYSRWRDYMDSMSMSEWREALYLELLNMISQFAEINYDEEIRDFTLMNGNEALRLLTINNGDMGEGKSLTNEELIEMLRGTKIWAKEKGGDEDEPWSDYYGSLIFAYRAEYQRANNYALTLFQSAELYKDRGAQKLSGYLGLLAWGNSQYRQNRKEEGVACILSGFLMAVETGIYIPFLENAVPVLTLFLIEEYEIGRSKEKEAVKKFVKTFSEYSPFVADYFGDEDPMAVIREEQQQLENKNSDSEEKMRSAIRIVNCISKLGQNDIARAVEIVRQYGDAVLDVVKDRKDVIDKVLILFSQILMSESKGERDINQIYNYISCAINFVEEKRKVFHQEERTGVSQEASMIYREYMKFLVVQKILGKNILPDGKNGEEELFFCVQRILPRTLEEQNIYNNECQVTKEEEEQFQRYIELLGRYHVQKRNNNEDKEALLKVERELEKQTNMLKDSHPYFQPLSQFNTYSIEQVQDRLCEDEVLIHSVALDNSLIIILISKKKHDIIIKTTNNFTEQLALYNKMWETGGNQEKCQERSDQIANIFFGIVYEFIKENQLKRVFIIPDFTMGSYSLAASRCNNEYLMDIVESVIHIANYNVLWRRAQRPVPEKIYNRIYGDDLDAALQQIRKWLHNMCNQYRCMSLLNDNNNFCLSEKEVNAYIVYGHGVHRGKQQDAVNGAVGIWSGNHIIALKDILKCVETQNLNYFILMSCSGGIPVGQDPERDQGSWLQMIERLRGGIISCHWDVKVEAVCCFLTELLNELETKGGMDIAFLKAIKATRQNYSDLEDWAGFEYWEN
ncbi:MAG: hypothetical protein K2N95_19195 [Lachnospiraceae bacterium]|nr:hypothetical protein [Lachnospiraceae bacterium]